MRLDNDTQKSVSFFVSNVRVTGCAEMPPPGWAAEGRVLRATCASEDTHCAEKVTPGWAAGGRVLRAPEASSRTEAAQDHTTGPARLLTRERLELYHPDYGATQYMMTSQGRRRRRKEKEKETSAAR